jgi:hypothetical protein
MVGTTGTLHEDLSTFSIISRSVYFENINVPNKCCTENQNTHFEFKNFFFSENRGDYEIM